MKVLFLSSWFPYPPDNGAKIRIFNLVRALAQRHNVTLLSFAAAGDATDLQALTPCCRVAAVVPSVPFHPRRFRALLGFFSLSPRSVVDTFSLAMARSVERELAQGQYDVVVAFELGTAPYAIRTSRVPALFEDVEVSVIRDAPSRATGRLARWRYQLTWWKMRRYMRGLCRQFAACTVVSALERDNLREVAPDYAPVHVIPNGVDVDTMRVGGVTPLPNTLVFNGALTFHANYDAVRYCLSDIWPDIKTHAPDARLQVTGRTNGVRLAGLALGGAVTLTGYLPDIRPTVASAWACIVPLRIGGGTRLKILEAMALGTPVISTRKGAEGLEVTHEENILIADEPTEFAAQTVRLLRDPALRQRLADGGRRLVEAKYRWSAIGEQFNQLVESVVAERRRA